MNVLHVDVTRYFNGKHFINDTTLGASIQLMKIKTCILSLINYNVI